MSEDQHHRVTDPSGHEITLTPFSVVMYMVRPHLDNIIAYVVGRDSDPGNQALVLSDVTICIVTVVYPSEQGVSQRLISMYGPISIPIVSLISFIMASVGDEPRRVMVATIIQLLWTHYVRALSPTVLANLRTGVNNDDSGPRNSQPADPDNPAGPSDTNTSPPEA